MSKQVSVQGLPSWHPPLDETEKLPWVYGVSEFKNWVFEVLLSCGKEGKYPKNLNEAIDIAEGAGYKIEVS